MSHKIFVGIGSNIDREMNIRSCIKILKDLYGNILISPIYISHRSILVGFMVMTKVITRPGVDKVKP